jgi:hypothetical protein
MHVAPNEAKVTQEGSQGKPVFLRSTFHDATGNNAFHDGRRFTYLRRTASGRYFEVLFDGWAQDAHWNPFLAIAEEIFHDGGPTRATPLPATAVETRHGKAR